MWDALLAAALGALSIIGLLTVDAEAISPSHRDADALGVLLTIGVWTAVAVRRRWPEATTWVVAALIMPFWVLDYVDVGTTIGVLIAIYTLAAHVDRPRSLQVGVVVGVALVAVMVSGVVAEHEDLPAIAVVGNVIIFATAWTVGDSVRSRRAYLAEVEARAEAAERDREQAAERAVQEERVRIARELHDVVAHSVSVMVVQAAAARRVLDRGDAACTAEALRTIETTGRNALDELRRLLGVLREDQGQASTSPQPTAGDVAALVDQCREAGLDVSLAVTGSPAELPAGVGLTVYRVVQEALTNVVKHAGVSQASVHLSPDRPGFVRMTVADCGGGFDPAGSQHGGGATSGGFGLFSIRERLGLLGGTFEIQSAAGIGSRIVIISPSGSSASDLEAPAERSPRRRTQNRVQANSADVEGPIRVLVVDDHEVVRHGLRTLLSNEPTLEVVGEASDGYEALAEAERLQPDVVLMDFSMPHMNGVEATRRLRQSMPHVRVVALSMYDEPDRAQAMLDAGACAYVVKSRRSEALIQTIQNVGRLPLHVDPPVRGTDSFITQEMQQGRREVSHH